MTIGLAPVIGIPLPFISYGGTALLLSLMAVGVLLNISSKCEINKNKLKGNDKSIYK